MKNKILIFIFSMCFFGYVYGEEFGLSKSDNLEYVPGEVIVKYNNMPLNSDLTLKSSKKISALNVEVGIDGLEVKDSLDNLGNIALVEIKDEKSVEEVIDLLSENPDVEYAEPNYIRYFFSDSVGDTRRNDQWGLDYINRDEAYNQYSGFLSNGTGIVVGVIDNGVNYNHPDLYDSMRNPENLKCKMKIENNIEDVDCIHGYDFLHSTPTPLPNLSSHGTHVAGIIAATINNGKGIIGVNPHAKIAALKVGNGSTLTTYAEIQAIDFAIQNGIKIINASYGAYGSGKAESEALKRYKDFGGLFITAAGNDYRKDIDNISKYNTYPCMYDLDNIICVASVDRNGNLSTFSNYGKKSVDIAAPGTSILSTSIEDLTISTGIYENDFEVDNGMWTGGEYYNWGNDTYAYGFYGELDSPSVDISGKDFVYIGFSLACASRGVDVEIQYSTGLGYSKVNVIPGVYNMGYYYTIPVEDKYYSDKFSFGLKTSKENTYCVIDDFSIYQDPYYESDTERYTFMNGTSMATPHVAGLASLVWTINPRLSYIDVKNLILDNGKQSEELLDLSVSGKIIDVKKTLEAATKLDVQPVSGLFSSRTGNIRWEELDGINNYYFEIISGDIVIKSGYTELTSVETKLMGNYMRRVQGIDKFGNKSDFSTGHICKKPVLDNIYLSGYECSNLIGNLDYKDNCSDSYEFIWLYNHQVTGGLTKLDNPGTLKKEFYIKNLVGEESDHIEINYEWIDSNLTFDKISYKYPKTITSSSQQNIGNIISVFGVKDGECGEKPITVKSVSCIKGKVSLNGRNLLITAESNQQGTSECTIVFADDEGNEKTGVFVYDFNTVNQTNGGGGGGGGGNVVSEVDSHGSSITNQKNGNVVSGSFEKVITGKNEDLVLEKDRKLEFFDTENAVSGSFDFSWFDNSDPSSLLSNGYTVEFNNAYEFAYKAGITTMPLIEKANMNGNLTRIAMAKMLSQYAMNILGKKPANIVTPKFSDVSQELDDNYGGAVELSYQLGIMGKGIKKFRPNDDVTRAEFATALSRMLYGIEDGKDWYYTTHMSKLKKEGIIKNVNPNLKELRGYVMIMLMRSAKK